MRIKFYRYAFVCLILSSSCLAVSSKITRHSTGADFLKGQVENTIVGSKGTISLGRSAEMLVFCR